PKMRRASSIALLMTERPGAVSTRAAAPRAASVAPDTAVPQSACFNAGASLTPSPVIATRWQRACSALTMAYLCSGKTRGKPSARSMASAIPAGTLLGSMSFGNASAAGMMCVPMPSWRAPLQNWLPFNEQQHNLYGVVDFKIGRFDVNAGVGYGLTPGSDRLMYKMIIG